jgi:putative ABC transport system permease protein
MLGMNIGVAAVIAIMASGLMARTAIMSGVEDIGATLIWIRPNWEAYENRSERIFLRPDDVENLVALVDDVSISIEVSERLRFSYRGVENTIRVKGVTGTYLSVWGWKLGTGRFITHEDTSLRRKVAVIGYDVAETFFQGEDPVGKYVKIGERSAEIIGVMMRRDRGAFVSDGTNDNTVYMPYPIVSSMKNWTWYGGERVLDINVQVNDIANLGLVVATFDRYLAGKYGTLDGKPRFVVHTAEENINTFNKIFSIVTTVISLIAGISLLVSGIGIMNIMLVSVTERTHEIGIRKAIGAKRRDVLLQFLIEAVIICLIGGGIGIAVGLGIAFAVASTQSWRYVMPVYAIALGLGVSATIGLFFGIYPAMKASRLDPVVALSREA